jgi:hypothetical protein
MRTVRTVIASGLLCGLFAAAQAQVAVLPETEPQAVFGGGVRTIDLRIQNTTSTSVVVNAWANLLQASSATVAPLATIPWKRVEVLPGQIIIESAQLSFPAVRGETRFIIQWSSETNGVFGLSEVLVYPTNLLEELKRLVGDAVVGLLCADQTISSLLQRTDIETANLQSATLSEFKGTLVILGPFASCGQVPENLVKDISALNEKGVAVVWLAHPKKLQSSFYSIPKGRVATVCADAALFENMEHNPKSQLTLIHCCRLALQPESTRLSEFIPKE